MVPINLYVFTGKAGKFRSQIGETVKLPVGCGEEVFKIASMHTTEQNSLLYRTDWTDVRCKKDMKFTISAKHQTYKILESNRRGNRNKLYKNKSILLCRAVEKERYPEGLIKKSI